MKYILQINTGSFSRSVFDQQAVLAKLDTCFSSLDVSRVIFGWSRDFEINRLIVNYLSSGHVEKYFWLPVFGEIHGEADPDSFFGIDGEGNDSINNLCQGESFDFVCQSSSKNLERALTVYQEIVKDLPVDGAFIDRIRYASAANSVNALYGCWCPQCKAKYLSAGIDKERIQTLCRKKDLSVFEPDDLNDDLTYHFADADINALMQVKRGIIKEAVVKLSEFFHSRGLKVGIDTFAPTVSDFVGQNVAELGSEVDFIKPMFYLRTYAPAGVPFEVSALGEKIHHRLDSLWGGDCLSPELTEKQLKTLQGSHSVFAPGIDSNAIEPICDADEKYILDSISRCENAGCGEVVLSWDILRIPDETIRIIGRR